MSSDEYGGQMPRRAVIVDAVRTPLGARNGQLRGWHPVELAAWLLRAVVERSDLDPTSIDDVIMGCVSQVGEQAMNIGRNAVLAAGLPDSVPGATIDRQCGSSQQALHFAAQGVMAGAYDVVIAAGVEVMTRIPIGASMAAGPGTAFSSSIIERYASVGGLQPQGIGAEMIAEQWKISREECDAYSVESHRRAALATREKRFEREIVPLEVTVNKGVAIVTTDEGVRPDLALQSLAKLKPAYSPKGMITAGNSSQIADGAAAVLIMSEDKAQQLGLRPIAYFRAFAVTGVDPVTALTGPIPATAKVLATAGLKIDEVDLVEINEAFAAVVLAWEKEHRPDMRRVNVNGGSIALGHPLGCSGARLLTTLVWELQRTEGRYGLLTIGEAGGMANATIIERL